MHDSNALWIVRTGALVFSVFGGLALVFAIVGLYGIKAYSVACRNREEGIPIALQAARGVVLAMFMREGFGMIASGRALGLLLSAAVGRFLRGFVFGIGSLDLVVFIIASLLLAVLSRGTARATRVPARRAASVSSITALRTD